MAATKSAVRKIPTPQLDDFPEIEFVPSASFRKLDRQYKTTTTAELCQIEPIERELREVSFDGTETGIATYLAELSRVPLLTQDEEYLLFQWMNYLEHRAAKLLKSRKKATRKLINDVQSLLKRAQRFRNRIVTANLRLVVSIAKKLVDRDNLLEDLISDGNLPLMRAVEIFDFERGLKFSTYATWAIRNSLFRSAPKNRKLARRFVNGAEEVFPMIEDESDVVRGRESYHIEIRTALDSLLAELDDREKIIVESRFGLNEEQRPYRFREIAETLGVSTERVRQLLARSLDQLQEQSDSLAIEVA